jgi:hypothetical protein
MGRLGEGVDTSSPKEPDASPALFISFPGAGDLSAVHLNNHEGSEQHEGESLDCAVVVNMLIT